MDIKRKAAALVLVLASGGTFAAIGNDEAASVERIQQVASVDSVGGTAAVSRADAAHDAQRLRAIGDKACRQAVDAATGMGETFREIGTELVPLMVKTGEEFARQLEPALSQMEPSMRQLAERMREIARQMEESLTERPSR